MLKLFVAHAAACNACVLPVESLIHCSVESPLHDSPERSLLSVMTDYRPFVWLCIFATFDERDSKSTLDDAC